MNFTELGTLTLAHLRLTLTAAMASCLLSVPLGVLASRNRKVSGLLLGVSGIIQTIPALAFLAAMVPLLSYLGAPAIGTVPAVLGLCAYAVFPILVATVTGIQQVPKELQEQTKAMGMTTRQSLLRVEIPLAAPLILAGVRTATVWTVGMATLATPIGAKSLGNYIFTGLQTRNHSLVLWGCVTAALLAIGLQSVVTVAERFLKAHKKAHFRWVVGTATALSLWIIAAPLVVSAFPKERQTSIGTKGFTEQLILGALIEHSIHQHQPKHQTIVLESLGSSVVFDGLTHNAIDLSVDYSGTLWNMLVVPERHKRAQGSKPPGQMALQGFLADFLLKQHNVHILAWLGFENSYAFAVQSDLADRLQLNTISDLAIHASQLELGNDYEFLKREVWKSLQNTYRLEFKATRTMDPALMYDAVSHGEVDVITAFTTDGRINTHNLRILTDDKHAIPAYDAALLANGQWVAEHPETAEHLRTLANSIDNHTMRRANLWVDIEKDTPSHVANRLLQQQ